MTIVAMRIIELEVSLRGESLEDLNAAHDELINRINAMVPKYRIHAGGKAIEIIRSAIFSSRGTIIRP